MRPPALALLALLAPLALVTPPARASSLGPGVRAGVSSEPDQVLVGGQLRLVGLFVAAPALWIEPNATVGFGDRLTVIQLSGDVKYAFPVGGLILFPLVGLSYAHASIDSDYCGGDCSRGELGLHLGGGLLYGRIGGDVVLSLTDDLPDVRLMVSYTF